MTVRGPLAVAVADFRERVRRPAYVVVLATAVGLGYLAVPEVDSRWVVVNAADYRGVYNSAYVGTVTALAGALWLTFAGFYVVRGAVVRDERTGVGQLLAATPLRSSGYLFGKFLSNLLVLGSMAGVLAATGLVMQLARGEDRAVDPVALLMPFGLLTVPVLAFAAAMAVLFDSVRPLRGGFGNIVWFFLAMVGMVVGQEPDAPLNGFGTQWVARSLRESVAAEQIKPVDGEFSLGLMYLDHPLRTFEWSGADADLGFVAQRLLLILVAAGIAVLPVLWFGRFDPARTRTRRHPEPTAGLPQPPPGMAPPRGMPLTGTPLTGTPPFGMPLTGMPLVGAPGTVVVDAPRTPRGGTVPSWLASHQGPAHGRGLRAVDGFGRLVAGEVRVLRRSGSRWWWLGTGLLGIAGAVAPIAAVPAVILPLAWIWPVLLWSRLGTQRHEYGVDALLGACSGVRRRMLAEWVAGLAIAGLTGFVPMLRMLLDQDAAGLAAWGAGLLFVPSLALASGVLSRTHRLFQVGYLALWYPVLNGIAALDFMGAVRVDARPAGPAPLVVGTLALALLGTALLVTTLRHARR
ncbi:hypothetical protein I0C86_17745 [Plantactinospora sp. S1510]|uniref:ABC transporter permease n=1 Tax=Plantactinospora alkalitolerans TaxID=2789879 RepID=A0ABS0GX54_9ACTN|nr:hypothetical protein [Plantactinospora alkalitolerans]MBF9130788.1 hypothetical protein [Plantactinospora alkalitolerans]